MFSIKGLVRHEAGKFVCCSKSKSLLGKPLLWVVSKQVAATWQIIVQTFNLSYFHKYWQNKVLKSTWLFLSYKNKILFLHITQSFLLQLAFNGYTALHCCLIIQRLFYFCYDCLLLQYQHFYSSLTVFAYFRSGYKTASKSFSKGDLEKDISGNVFMITGGNSGIGKAAALTIAKKGGEVHIVCRNLERANQAKADIIQASDNEVNNFFVLFISRLCFIFFYFFLQWSTFNVVVMYVLTNF